MDTTFAGLEALRYGPAEGDEPPPPKGFGKDEFELMEHAVKRLQQMHPDPPDMRKGTFVAETHQYAFDGVPYRQSVTALAGSCIEEFNEVNIISKMKASAKEAWPRLKYAKGARMCTESELDAGGLFLAVQHGVTIFAGAVPEGKERGAWLREQARRRFKGGDAADVTYYSYTAALSDDEIKESWERNRTIAANKGTYIHHQLECWANSMPCRTSEVEVQNGLRFLEQQLLPLGAKVYRTEWEIFYHPYIAGSVDLVLRLPDGRLIVCDWKRATNHDVHSPYRRRMMPPLGHLHDTPVAKFALQLGIYKWILETRYGFTVAGLVLAGVEPDHPFHTWVPYLKEEVEWLMSTTRERAAAEARIEAEVADVEERMRVRKEKSASACEAVSPQRPNSVALVEELVLENRVPRCAHTGKIAWEPVRVGEALYDRPAALMAHGAGVIPDKDAQNVADLLLKQVTAEPSAELQALQHCVPWANRIPKDGFLEFDPTLCAAAGWWARQKEGEDMA